VRWRSVVIQWLTFALLLAMLVAIQYYKPEWTGIDLGTSTVSKNQYHAIDGDSFKAGDVEIRLYGIDAPEYRQTCRDGEGHNQPCGKMAGDALSKLIGKAAITCTTLDRDRYGRQVSVCKDGTRDINREMVRQGWAIAYRKHALDYVSAEREAKTAKRGIWAWSFEKPEDYRNRIRAVEGNLVGED
jgi:endonuclease YncB( thermonuclease family)